MNFLGETEVQDKFIDFDLTTSEFVHSIAYNFLKWKDDNPTTDSSKIERECADAVWLLFKAASEINYAFYMAKHIGEDNDAEDTAEQVETSNET